jgi:hypothetical protein
MTQLQKIVAKAKTLRKSYPKLKWTDLIKKASKLVTPAKKSVSGIKRTIVKKSAPAIPLIKKRIVSKSDFAMAGVKKKKATKKAVKKSPLRSMHKDTKSHNVNIRVMSGMNGSEQFVKQLNSLLADKKKLESDLNIYKQRKKENVKFSSFNALHFKRLPSMIKSVNTQIREAKKHIK